MVQRSEQAVLVPAEMDEAVGKSKFGLSNTMPLATSGLVTYANLGRMVEASTPRGAEPAYSRSGEGFWTEYRKALEHFVQSPTAHIVLTAGEIGVAKVRSVAGSPSPRPDTPSVTRRLSGQVKLFQIVMGEWGFSEEEAATILGFESVADLRDVLRGRRSIGQRDANDRLRSVLRIAADLNALYRDKSVAKAWLEQPQQKLGGLSPRQLLTEGSMENLLVTKYYVAELSGR